MELSGLHLLLTYQCTSECDHCFVWGSPWQHGTMTLEEINKILQQAEETNSVEWIYFEGGEPFLYYPMMLAGINEAVKRNFKVGIVTNTYWATSKQDAILWLTPLAGKIQDLTISSDLFHFSEKISQQSKFVTEAANELDIPIGTICIELPETSAQSSLGQIPQEPSSIMYRGRAADKLASQAMKKPSVEFTTCPHEDLRDPGRVHIDPYGYVHICQGITIGNINNHLLKDICQSYNTDEHPIIKHLLHGGPVELAREYDYDFNEEYADACHLCYETRKFLRKDFTEILAPNQMYGVEGEF